MVSGIFVLKGVREVLPFAHRKRAGDVIAPAFVAPTSTTLYSTTATVPS